MERVSYGESFAAIADREVTPVSFEP